MTSSVDRVAEARETLERRAYDITLRMGSTMLLHAANHLSTDYWMGAGPKWDAEDFAEAINKLVTLRMTLL